MDEPEIKIDLDVVEDDLCSTCLSSGRKLFSLDKYSRIYRKLTSHLQKADFWPYNETKVCWECHALLCKVAQFQQKVKKVHDMFLHGQINAYESLSTLSTVTNNIKNEMYVEETLCSSPKWDQTNNKIKADPDTFPEAKVKNDFSTNEDEVDKMDVLETEVTDHSFDGNENLDAIEDTWKKKIAKLKILQKKWQSKKNLEISTRVKFHKFKNVMKQKFLDIKNIEEDLRRQREKISFISKRYKCIECAKVFKNASRLLSHNTFNHSPNNKFRCDICTCKYQSKKLLEVHIVNNHMTEFECTLCGFICSRIKEKKDHINKKHGSKYECMVCGMMFKTRLEFKSHYSNLHNKFTCDYCGKFFRFKFSLAEHISRWHILTKRCKFCRAKFATSSELSEHRKLNHEKKPVYCVQCDKYIKSAYDHFHRSKAHSTGPKKQFLCPDCGKSFTRNIRMKNHYDIVHAKVFRFQCDICNQVLTSGARLRSHKEGVHKGIKPPNNKMCSICGRGFQSTKSLTYHIRTHTGERPHTCPHCPAAFAQPWPLKMHIKKQHRK